MEDPPRIPLKKGDLKLDFVPPFLRGARGDRASVANIKLIDITFARSGDKDAFGQLIERYHSMAKRIAIAMVANEDVAQDLVQEAMLQAYLCIDRLKDGKRFQNWLYAIVLNVCRSYIRDRKAVFFSLEAIARPSDAIALAEPVKVAECRFRHSATAQCSRQQPLFLFPASA